MWSELPMEIIFLILERLMLVDYIRFGAVCVGWRSAIVAKNRPSPVPQFPWIMLSFNPDSEIREFLSPSENKVYKLNLPEAREARCCGSSHGWMIMSHRTRGNFLFNPISRARIQLPSQNTLKPTFIPPSTRIDEIEAWNCDPGYIMRATLSSVPSSANIAVGNCIVAVIYDKHQNLAFCRPGDESWTVLRMQNYQCYDDVIIYKGMLCAVNKNKELIAWELGSNPKGRVVLEIEAGVFIPSGWSQLMESNGELFMVPRFGYPFGCLVFKQVQDVDHWMIVESLGDHMLFLGSPFSGLLKVSSEARELGFKENCVYFKQLPWLATITATVSSVIAVSTENSSSSVIGDNVCTIGDLCAFHLGHGGIEPYYSSRYHPYQFTSIWVTPNL